jgi:hypothetical protein
VIVLGAAIEADVLRIRHEFLEMPGLLETLEAEGFLVSGPNGAYRRSPSRRD